MPYDPNYPADGIKIRAVDFRNQFAAMKALIDDQAATIAALTAQVAALAVALANTAQNPSVSQMGLGLSDPPSQVQLQAIYDTLNTLINQLVRV